MHPVAGQGNRRPSLEESRIAVIAAAYASFSLPTLDTTGRTAAEVADEIVLLLNRTLPHLDAQRSEDCHA